MDISFNWLKQIAPSIRGSAEEVSRRLGLLGAPVDDLIALSEGLGDILVARVEEVRAHPNADRLRLCTVNAGGEAVQVVCGAPNVEAGRCYPFAPIGATMPGGMEIRKAKLRGETSEGMLCSAKELGLGRDHSGLMTLNGEWELGGKFVDQLGLDDYRMVVDLTPNRPDLLSHLGVAREVAPEGVADLRLPDFGVRVEFELVEGGTSVSAGGIEVMIEDAADCPRYTALVIEGVAVGPSPEWLATRLRAVGLRPINNVVDATNYVLYEIGQPLHAFDLDLLGNAVGVRRATSGETIRTLDGVDRTLEEGALVITDGKRPVALAGIMGGEDTEVGDSTTRVLLECALFDPLKVRKTAKKLGLNTDASHRFERGVDPRQHPIALRRVAELIVATAGGQVAPRGIDAHPGKREPTQVEVRRARVEQVLGVAMQNREITDLLSPIGFEAAETDGGLRLTVPTYRPDVTREIDVIEEIARRRGYDSFDAALGSFRPGVVPEDRQVELQQRIHRFFGRWGFLEARTAAFAPAAEDRVALLNPLSLEESHLRSDLTSGLLTRVEHNWSHGVRAIRLYEIGTVFGPSNGSMPHEEIRVAAVVTGPSSPPHWSGPTRNFDLWDLKGLAQELAGELGVQVEAGGSDAGVAATLWSDERFALLDPDSGIVGSAGLVLDARVDSPPWAGDVFAIEVRLRPSARATVKMTPLPAFPGVERDLALIIPAGVSAAAIGDVLKANGGDILESVAPFDLYQGEGLPAGTHSIAWRLNFRNPERTLTDQEVDRSIDKVLSALDEELGVRRRG